MVDEDKEEDPLSTFRGRFAASGLAGAVWAFACLPVGWLVGELTSPRIGLVAYVGLVVGGLIAWSMWEFRDELRGLRDRERRRSRA